MADNLRRMVVESVGSRGLSADFAAEMGEAYWGRTPDGMAVDIAAHQMEVQKGWKQEGITAMVPWLSPVIDDVYRDYIFNTNPRQMSEGQFGDYAQKAKERIQKNMESYLQKAYDKAEENLTGIKKATTTTSLSNMMHVIADQEVTYLYKRPYPVQTLIPVEANKGKTANWDSVGPYEFGSAAFGGEDPTLTESDITTHNRSATIKYMYAVGRLTKAVIFAGRSQIPARDIKAIRVDTAQDALRALRERSLLGVTRDVTSTTNAFTAAASNQYAGMYELITNNTNGNPTTSNQCWVDVSSSSVDTYGEIMQYLDTTYNYMVLYGMQPNLAICDYKTFGLIRRGLAEYFRYSGEGQELIPGVSKLTLTFPNAGGIPLVPHPFLRMSTGTYGSIFLIDTRLFARRVLWQDTYEELANTNTSQKFVISASETLIEKSDVDGSSSLQGGLFGITI